MHICPVQIPGHGMEPARLKKEFGDKIVFWGGAYDTQLNSPTDSYKTVYERVKENIEIFSDGGGYIMFGVHNLPPDIPEHHLQAMLDAWRDAG